MSIATTNPATNEVLKTFPALTASEIEIRVSFAASLVEKSLLNLPQTRGQRAQVIANVASLLDKRKEEFAKLISLEMGKTFTSAIQEIEKCAANCRYYAEVGLAGLAPEKIILDRSSQNQAEVHYFPLGVVLAIMPWNFPFWQVIRGAAPILLAGNSILLKHASNVPQCALAIEKLFWEAGLNEGSFQTLLINSDQIPALIADHRIQGVTLTGSEEAGREVASLAGKFIKKSVMELGGSDPFIVMPSADLKKAVENATKARLVSNGQSCVAAKRFIVHEQIYDAFKAALIDSFQKIKMGDPLDEKTELGPLVSVSARQHLHELVQDAVATGAKVLVGGEIPAGKGAFYPATILENISSAAKIYHEEAFGPVASLYCVKDFQAALQLANATRFGLGSSFWSQDQREIDEAMAKVQAGSLFINTMVASDPHLPFGGVKSSGYGRELGSPGLREFVNIKTIVRNKI
jgi:succinate-semialdehyde dehydrogenase/glutarate-semialdehyde dehydrogenase